ncbi:MAG: uracil-DNA glycosylase family protein [Pseudomonadota bacterium]
MKSQLHTLLVHQRREETLQGYESIGKFHDGMFECDYVTPWTISGNNFDADVMVIGQDWSSSGHLSRPRSELENEAAIGFSPRFPTNSNLDGLLARHFGMSRGQCFLTNVFPYIKRGKASAPIRRSDLVLMAERFTLREIEIVEPRLAICLGKEAFLALRRAKGIKGNPKMDELIASPFEHRAAQIHASAHLGSWGFRNRGPGRVEADWTNYAACLKAVLAA